MSSNSISFYDNKKNNEVLSTILNIFAVVFLIAGVILPLIIFSNIGWKTFGRNPELSIFPIYLGILLITFSGLSYLISVILLTPSQKTLWIENIVSNLGFILIIIGLIGFWVAVSKTNGSFSELQNYGFIGGLFILLFHADLGLICIGTAALHKKYSVDYFDEKSGFGDENTVYCENCGKKVSDPTSSFCESCGTPLRENTQQKKENLSVTVDETNIILSDDEQEVLNSFIRFGVKTGDKLVMERKSRKIDRLDQDKWKNIEEKGKENEWVILFEK